MNPKMDPKAGLPTGQPLILQQARSSAPFSREATLAAREGRREDEIKPLRPPKERQPVADEVDELQLLNAVGAANTIVATAPPVAPAAAGLPATFLGGADNGTTMIPPVQSVRNMSSIHSTTMYGSLTETALSSGRPYL